MNPSAFMESVRGQDSLITVFQMKEFIAKVLIVQPSFGSGSKISSTGTRAGWQIVSLIFCNLPFLTAGAKNQAAVGACVLR